MMEAEKQLSLIAAGRILGYNKHRNPENGLASMPNELIGQFANGGIVCDMLDGPCSCGAWHHQNEWPDDVQLMVFGNIEECVNLYHKRHRVKKYEGKYGCE